MSIITQGQKRVDGLRAASPRWRRIKLGRVLLWGAAILVGLYCLIPLYWIVIQSFMHEPDIYHWPPFFYPVRPTLQNNWENFFCLVAFARIGLELTIASLAAYAFARLEFPGRDAIFFVILTTMMIPGQVTLVPMYLQMSRLGWIDTYHALIWPGAASVFPVFMLRQFFQTIPQDMEEAAILDGCGRLRVLWRVILPLSTPALSALSIFIFMGNWNSLFWPLIVTNSNEMRTLVAGLTVLRATHSQHRGRVMAASVFSVIPVIIFYSIFQRRIIEGVTMTGLAGT